MKARAPDYAKAILDLLKERGPKKTICPSELLNAVDKQNPAKMEAVRAAAKALVAQGKIEICQKGKVVDPATIKGPIRLRLIKT